MERRSFVQGAGLAGVLAAGVAPAVVHAQANIRWRLTSSFPKSLDTLFGVNDIFAAKVKDLSGGKFQITTHPPGELVPAFGTIDAVKDGTVYLNDAAQVTATDIKAANGVIHVIDQVILPPTN